MATGGYELNDLRTKLLSRTLAVAVLAWIGFAVLTVEVVRNPAGTTLDLWLAPRAFDVAVTDPWVAGLGRFLDVLGGNLVSVVIVLWVSLGLFTRQHRVLAGYLLASAVGGVLISTLVKTVLDRPRPLSVGTLLSESTSSYPSGHATSGITVFVALGVVALAALSPRWRWWVAAPLFVLGPVIGLSRVVIGVHWPTDVLGGWALGIAWTSTAAIGALLVARSRSSSRRMLP
jgi:membrane-associated phospholipid phosphatase